MRIMQLASPEWDELKSAIAAGSAPAGVFLVRGPSEAIAVQAQALLRERSLQNAPVSYFLSSGRSAFQVPCFWPFPGKQPAPEALDIQRLYQARARLLIHHPMLNVLTQLEAAAPGAQAPPQLVVLEYLTPPAERDLAFPLLLLKSLVPQLSSLVLLVHQQSTPDRLPRPHHQVVESLLCLLYLSGGRLRQADWHTLLAHYPARDLDERFIASRQVGREGWVCYADWQVAELAEALFQSMEPGRRQALARSWWRLLPHWTGYPLLSIAAETNDLEVMLSAYSAETLQMACLAPEWLVRYYDRLQQLAHAAGEASLSSEAETLSLAAQFLLSTTPASEVYQRLHGVLPGATSGLTPAFFWFVLGQVLARSDRPTDWEYASECFRLCIDQAQGLKQRAVRQLLAGMANAEALIAYKQGEADKARDLAAFALAQVRGLADSLLLQIHIRINVGDLYLRLLGDVQAAITHYRGVLLTIAEAGEQFTKQFLPADRLFLKHRAALRLGEALIQAGQYTEATQLLAPLLKELHMASGLNRVGERHAEEVLKTTLALAQASLKAGQERRAVLCYWHLLRHPQGLEPLALREAGAKLRDCRPALNARLQRRIARIVSEQEAIVADARKVEEVFTEMQRAHRIRLGAYAAGKL